VNLNAILASRWFRSSQLQKQLLKFVVLKTLDGKADEIKEYAIGADAFDRGPDFDPRIDSVVRVVARRVRDRLAEYYRNEGKADSVVIKLSVGSYIPSFFYQEEGQATTPVSTSPPPPSSSAIALSRPGSQRRWMLIASAPGAVIAAALCYRLLFEPDPPSITDIRSSLAMPRER
jgi:hypothetical protein